MLKFFCYDASLITLTFIITVYSYKHNRPKKILDNLHTLINELKQGYLP